MSYETLKESIVNAIKPNGNQEITGQLLQDTLVAMVEEMEDRDSTKAEQTDLEALSQTVTNNKSEAEEALAEAVAPLAEKDGTYKKMSVGFAEHLVGDGTATEEEFSFRPTAGVDRNVETTTYDYDMRSNFGARIESVKGNSVVWNQKAQQKVVGNNQSGGWYGVNSIEKDGDAYTVSDTMVSRNYLVQYIDFDSTHKYLITYGIMVTSEIADGSHRIGYLGESTTQWLGTVDKSEVYNKRKDFAVFITPLAGNIRVNLGIYTPLMSQIIYSPRIHDLTQMFGAGNEPTTVEEFYSLLPKNVDLNAYNVGEMVDANYGAIKTKGFNQWDEQWEVGTILQSTGKKVDATDTIRSANFIKVIPNATYYVKSNATDNLVIFGYDSEKQFVKNYGGIRNTYITIDSNVQYLMFRMATTYGATYKNDICLNLAWDEYASLNGTYAPYKPFERDLSWVSQYFPNGMRRAGSAFDEIRFNSTTQKWEAVQRVGIVDLGSLSWTKGWASSDNKFYTQQLTSNASVNNVIMAKYAKTSAAAAENMPDKTFIVPAKNVIVIYDSAYTNAATFKTDMQGVMLYYELAEPIVTEIEEIPSLDYDVADYGTEELIVAEGVKSAPFHADIIYTPNALKTLEQVPDILKRLSALETAMTTTTTTTE